MKKILGTLVIAFALSTSGVAQARTLPMKVAVKLSKRLATQQYDKRDIVHQHVSPPDRVSPGRVIFRYNDRTRQGQACTAQIVVRFRSRGSSVAVGFFRDVRCSLPGATP